MGVANNSVSMDGDFTAPEWPLYSHTEPVIANVTGIGNLVINAQDAAITTQKDIGIEVSRDGAASAFVTVTVNVNNTTSG